MTKRKKNAQKTFQQILQTTLEPHSLNSRESIQFFSLQPCCHWGLLTYMQVSNCLDAVPPLLAALFSQETITISNPPPQKQIKIPIFFIQRNNFIFIAFILLDLQAFRVSCCIPVDSPDVYQTASDLKNKCLGASCYN